MKSFGDAELLRFGKAAVLLGVPSFFLGLVYPGLVRSPRFPVETASSFAAQLGVASAVGSGIGAMGVAHVLIPAVGSELIRPLLPAAVTTTMPAFHARSTARHRGSVL